MPSVTLRWLWGFVQIEEGALRHYFCRPASAGSGFCSSGSWHKEVYAYAAHRPEECMVLSGLVWNVGVVVGFLSFTTVLHCWTSTAAVTGRIVELRKVIVAVVSRFLRIADT